VDSEIDIGGIAPLGLGCMEATAFRSPFSFWAESSGTGTSTL